MAAIIMGIWLIYIGVQITDMWAKRTTGPIDNYYYAVNTVTVFYSAVLCGILYMSILRVVALVSGNPSNEVANTFSTVVNKKRYMEISGIFLVAVIFLVRGVRTVLIFIAASTADKSSSSIPALNANATALQVINRTALAILEFNTMPNTLACVL
jgi:hypothetical protein